MKHFKHIIQQLKNQLPAIVLYLLPVALIVPNIVLDITENLYPPTIKAANILLPLGIYILLLSVWKKNGWMSLFMIPIMVLCAFQIVLLYLYGQSIIAIDMFLNVATTNSREVGELLKNLKEAILIVVVLYTPFIVAAIYLIIKKKYINTTVMKRGRIIGLITSIAGVICLALSAKPMPMRTIFPLNVSSNIVSALSRVEESRNYIYTSSKFVFNAKTTRTDSLPEIYVLVIGETARAGNWQLCGYQRHTNPKLSSRDRLIFFPKTLSESNTTHKSVPLILSHLSAREFGDSLKSVKCIFKAFEESGFKTAWFSNQQRNHSYIDEFGNQADTCLFISDDGCEHFDEELIPLLTEFCSQHDKKKKFVVLHSYGSHFNYDERCPDKYHVYEPCQNTEADKANRQSLINAYDNTVLYTDYFLDKVASVIDSLHCPGAMLYLADHGEDIFDDNRERFLHASPTATFWQLHVPMFIYANSEYSINFKEKLGYAEDNSHKIVSSSSTAFNTILDIAGIDTPFLNKSQSLVSPSYSYKDFCFLNDYNEAVDASQAGMNKTDLSLMKNW